MRPLPPSGLSPSGSTNLHYGVTGLLFNHSLLAALLSCTCAQLAKPLVHWHNGKQLDWLLALSPGGMPSSHTASVVGLTTALGLHEGTSSTIFALSLVLSLVVAYDATGIRLHAGRHASVLNVIVAHLPPEHPAFETVQLQETLGHTPFEVVMGAAVGLVIGAVVTGLWGLVAG